MGFFSDNNYEKEASAIFECFGLDLPENHKETTVVSLLKKERISLDDDCLTFNFRKPLELKNGEKIESVEIREPNARDLEYIRKGFIASSNGVDSSQVVAVTTRVLIKICNLPTGVADRVKSGDIDVLGSLLVELGFFGR